jgi:hypothetical protein
MDGYDSAGIYAREFVQRMEESISATPTVRKLDRCLTL